MGNSRRTARHSPIHPIASRSLQCKHLYISHAMSVCTYALSIASFTYVSRTRLVCNCWRELLVAYSTSLRPGNGRHRIRAHPSACRRIRTHLRLSGTPQIRSGTPHSRLRRVADLIDVIDVRNRESPGRRSGGQCSRIPNLGGTGKWTGRLSQRQCRRQRMLWERPYSPSEQASDDPQAAPLPAQTPPGEQNKP